MLLCISLHGIVKYSRQGSGIFCQIINFIANMCALIFKWDFLSLDSTSLKNDETNVVI